MYFLVDCNSFFVSCERLFDPALAKRPVAVLSSNDGCIVARSPEVKKLGIPVGMPAFKVKDEIKKHDIAIYSSNFALYADISNRVMNVLRTFDSLMEVYSIDEAFLRLPEQSNYLEVAQDIRKKIQKWVGIGVSVGFGPTKTLAKLANAYAKKTTGVYGVYDNADELLMRMPVSSIWGIGRQYDKLLTGYKVRTAYDLVQCDDKWIRRKMTITGLRTVWELRGTDCITEPTGDAQNIIRSRSFRDRVTSKYFLKEAVLTHIGRAAYQLRKNKQVASAVTVFITTGRHAASYYSNSATIQVAVATNYTPLLGKYAQRVLDALYKESFGYKKVAVILSGLSSENEVQMSLFSQTSNDAHERSQMKALDLINDKWGRDTVLYAGAGIQKVWRMRQDRKSPHYSTLWSDIPKIK